MRHRWTAVLLFAIAGCGCGHGAGPKLVFESVMTLSTRAPLPAEARVGPALLARIERELDMRALRAKLKDTPLEKEVPRDPFLDHLSTSQLLEIQKRSGNYGDEGREPALAKARPANLEANILATAALVPSGLVTETQTGWTLEGPALMDSHGVCETELFAKLPTAAFCSGFLVGKNVLATAYHCIEDDPDLTSTRFVFGFHQRDDGSVQTEFAKDEILMGSQCYDGQGSLLGSAGDDWVLVCLKGDPPPSHKAVTWRSSGKVADHQELYVVGHPSGLPVVYDTGGQVVINSPNTYFVTNLDTYHGNSGSPVFNATTDEVEGMLVRGESDYVSAGTCKVPRKCALDLADCSGEEVLRVTVMKLP